ncbi:MAG: DUF433 domain-containing protein [Cyanobacteria bacterium]|nr:DUF433 domain-containing protein [Cyanobacteriota bacterium]MDW8201153.1 DUF433 domain-containing protein [Cyanobacteriota bacterium SKYGB_h_bin112]
MGDLYGGHDPRDIPTYSIGYAARCLRIPAATIRSWTVGQTYPVAKGERFFQPLIPIADRKPRQLSFTNLIELHVLRAIRKHHQLKLSAVRQALDFIDQHFKIDHPLAREQFRTDGVDLFIDRYGEIINVSRQGQLDLRNSLNAHLERIQPDDSGFAIKLYPFTRSDEAHNPKIVVIDPRIAFGRLVIAGTGIPTHIIAERYKAGDSLQDLVDDYECEPSQIEEAIRCELPVAA